MDSNSYSSEEPSSPISNGPLSPTICVTNFEAWENNKKYTTYKVNIMNKDKIWVVSHRYNEFVKLQECLKKQFPGLQLKLPGKRLFGNNFSADFISNRRQGLNNFVHKLLTDSRLLNHPDVKLFLNINNNTTEILNDGEQVDAPNETNEIEEETYDIEKSLDLGPTEKKHVKPSDFEFLKVIGKGSFGKVMLAKHRVEETIYAVKVLQKKLILKRNEKNHIMAERNVLLQNIENPFLVGLHYSFQTRDKLYFVLDYVNGGELFFHLQRERMFVEPRARFYAAEITSALGYLHQQGIIYRDLKPENILLDRVGHIVLTDFGLCKEGISAKKTTNTFCGTPEYLAPEVLRKEAYDKAVDWWCLGAVLYEMLYGLPPFYSRDTAEMYDNILNKPLRLKPTASMSARQLLEGLLQKDKNFRTGSLRDVAELKEHEFFSQISWPDLEAKLISPPYNPGVKGNLDLKNIDPEFIREPVPASVGKSQGMSVSVQDGDNAFVGFSYAPPLNLN